MSTSWIDLKRWCQMDSSLVCRFMQVVKDNSSTDINICCRSCSETDRSGDYKASSSLKRTGSHELSMVHALFRTIFFFLGLFQQEELKAMPATGKADWSWGGLVLSCWTPGFSCVAASSHGKDLGHRQSVQHKMKRRQTWSKIFW